MTVELVNLFATLATLIVVAATAVAALIQMRHMGRGNQLAAFNELVGRLNGPELASAQRFVMNELKQKMSDPVFREQLMVPDKRTAQTAVWAAQVVLTGNYYEEMGLLVKSALVDRELICDGQGSSVLAAWDAMLEVIATWRVSDPRALENFEYLAVVVQDWNARNPNGTYPRGVRRLTIPPPG